MKKELMIIADYSLNARLSFAEFCEASQLSKGEVIDLIAYEIIHPIGSVPQQWEFDLAQLIRLKRALRLQHDLEINLNAVAVVLDLLEEVEELRARLKLLNRHYLDK